MDDFYEKLLKQLSHELRTQDNRITADPLFCVEQKKYIFGMDPTHHSDGWIWQNLHDFEKYYHTTEDALDDMSAEELEACYDKLYYVEYWEFKTAHFTETAAQLYIDQNKHNLTSPRIFVTSQYRCHEWNEVIEYIKGIE